jgi:hypothetical protein
MEGTETRSDELTLFSGDLFIVNSENYKCIVIQRALHHCI